MNEPAVTKFVGGQVPAELADRLKQLAEENDRPVAAELRQALRRHIEASDVDVIREQTA
jgi:predicted DNA-binding protein